MVTVEGQDWHTDPFTLTETIGRLYGRGTSDMKGFIAASLAVAPQAVAADLKQPIWIALSYDEEYGMTGAPPMIAHMLGNGLSLSARVIVGEPSGMGIVAAHKGIFNFDVNVHGHEVHSAQMDQGVSAVMYSADLIAWANEVNRDLVAATPDAESLAFDPPFSTIHVGQISGGTATNITAKDCHFGIEFRVLPHHDADVLRKGFLDKVAALNTQMQAVHPMAHIDATEDFCADGLMSHEGHGACGLAMQLTGQNDSRVVSFASESRLFQKQGLSTVICGPGDIAQAHQPNEFLSVAQLGKAQLFLRKLVGAMSH